MVDVATGSLTELSYYVESTYGETATPGSKAMLRLRRRNAGGLNLTKDAYDSEEIRSDRMTADSRHGTRRSGGDVETELSVKTYDDFIAGLMGRDLTATDPSGDSASRGWRSLTSITDTPADMSVTVSGGYATYTSAANATFITDGLRVGDRVTWSGWTDAGNNGTKTIVALTELTMTVLESGGVADAGPDADAAYVGVGRRSVIGPFYNSFQIERGFTDITQYQQFRGMRVNSAAFSLPPTGISTVTWNFIGSDASPLSASTIASGTSDITTGSVLASVDGILAIKGAGDSYPVLESVVTGLEFTVDNQMGGTPVVGTNFIPNVLWGIQQQVSGTVTVLFSDERIYNLFEAETESQLLFRLNDVNGTDWLQVYIPRLKLNSGNIGDAVSEGLPVEMEFRGLKPDVVTNPGEPNSQIVFLTSASAITGGGL